MSPNSRSSKVVLLALALVLAFTAPASAQYYFESANCDNAPLLACLLGRGGGQVFRGGTGSAETLDLLGTSHATPGPVRIYPDGFALGGTARTLLQFPGTYTSTGGVLTAVDATFTESVTTAVSGPALFRNAATVNGSTILGSLTGYRNIPTINATGAATFMFVNNGAFEDLANFTDSGGGSWTFSNPYSSFRSAVTNNTGDTLGDFYLFRAEDPTGAWGTVYGFNCDAIDAGGTTTACVRSSVTANAARYAFLDDGGANSAFAGGLRLGGTAQPEGAGFLSVTAVGAGSCDAGDYWQQASTTGNSWKMCNNGTLIDFSSAGTGDITDVFNCNNGDCNNIATTDGDFLDFSAVNNSGTSEGIKLPQGTAPTGGTGEGQIAYETDAEVLRIGNGTASTALGPAARYQWVVLAEDTCGNGTEFTGPGFECDATETNVDVAIPTDITVVGLAARQEEDGTCTLSFTVRDDTADTAATCSTTNADNCVWTGSVSVAAGSLVDLEVTDTGANCTSGSRIHAVITYTIP